MKFPATASVLLLAAGLTVAVPATAADAPKSSKGETARAEQNRRKPLQRCDELKDKAQLDCLRKARENIVQARAKREAAGEKRSDGSGK